MIIHLKRTIKTKCIIFCHIYSQKAHCDITGNNIQKAYKLGMIVSNYVSIL